MRDEFKRRKGRVTDRSQLLGQAGENGLDGKLEGCRCRIANAAEHEAAR
jgi:hypothetical protein